MSSRPPTIKFNTSPNSYSIGAVPTNLSSPNPKTAYQSVASYHTNPNPIQIFNEQRQSQLRSSPQKVTFEDQARTRTESQNLGYLGVPGDVGQYQSGKTVAQGAPLYQDGAPYQSGVKTLNFQSGANTQAYQSGGYQKSDAYAPRGVDNSIVDRSLHLSNKRADSSYNNQLEGDILKSESQPYNYKRGAEVTQ
ncbi:unnamed protein product [Sphagnum balticum]